MTRPDTDAARRQVTVDADDLRAVLDNKQNWGEAYTRLRAALDAAAAPDSDRREREHRLILSTTARTLYTAALWMGDEPRYEGWESDREMLRKTAAEVERYDPYLHSAGCPVCEEIDCDESCPLEPLRRQM